MGKLIPPAVADELLTGLPLISRGKVRDRYDLGKGHTLSVVSDRVSAFDFVLNAKIPGKGYCLTAQDIHSVQLLHREGIALDLAAYGSGIIPYLPTEQLRGNLDLQRRAIVTRNMEMFKVELVVRDILTGSGWEEYQTSQSVCGIPLLAGLYEGARLPRPILTPTEKSEDGHDERMPINEFYRRFGADAKPLEELALKAFKILSEAAAKRGIILVDTKFEIGRDKDGSLVLADERGTADASRFWRSGDYQAFETERRKGKNPSLPQTLDKQFIRNFLKGVGITNKLQPTNLEDVLRVHSQAIPTEVIQTTSTIYRYLTSLLTRCKLEMFQIEALNIAQEAPPLPPVEIVIGSESDSPQIAEGVAWLTTVGVKFNVSVISCHRNPDDLAEFCSDTISENAVVIAGAGKAAALPGVLCAWLRNFDKNNPVLGVAFKSGDEEEELAARLSITQLPGRPVITQANGCAYFGAAGFTQACVHAVSMDHLVLPSTSKPAQIHFMSNPQPEKVEAATK